jgi:hypothetical protein
MTLQQQDLLSWTPPNMDRGGTTYSHSFDYDRLNRQQRAVYDVVKDGAWRTLQTIAGAAGAPEASASARLRDLRKLGLTVDRERDPVSPGLFWYRVRCAPQ